MIDRYAWSKHCTVNSHISPVDALNILFFGVSMMNHLVNLISAFYYFIALVMMEEYEHMNRNE